MDETNEVKIKKAIDHLADQIVIVKPPTRESESQMVVASNALTFARAIEHLANALKTLH